MNESNLNKLIAKIGNPIEPGALEIDLESLIREKTHEDADWYYQIPEPGLELSFSQGGRLSSISFSTASESLTNTTYNGSLPLFLKRNMTRDQIRATLGTPISSGAPTVIPLLGPSGGWDSFAYPNREDIQLISGYTPELKIRTLKLTASKEF
jgi:hypothetical protein